MEKKTTNGERDGIVALMYVCGVAITIGILALSGTSTMEIFADPGYAIVPYVVILCVALGIAMFISMSFWKFGKEYPYGAACLVWGAWFALTIGIVLINFSQAGDATEEGCAKLAETTEWSKEWKMLDGGCYLKSSDGKWSDVSWFASYIGTRYREFDKVQEKRFNEALNQNSK